LYRAKLYLEATTDPLAVDFRCFLLLIWQHLNPPELTNAQYEITGLMQQGFADGYDPKIGRVDIVRAFRRFRKSYIAAACTPGCLCQDPKNEKILKTTTSGKPKNKNVRKLWFAGRAKEVSLSAPEGVVLSVFLV